MKIIGKPRVLGPWTMNWAAANTVRFLRPNNLVQDTSHPIPSESNVIGLGDADLVCLYLRIVMNSGAATWTDVSLRAVGGMDFGATAAGIPLGVQWGHEGDVAASFDAIGDGNVNIFAAPNIALSAGALILDATTTNAYVPQAPGPSQGGPIWLTAACAPAEESIHTLVGLGGYDRLAWTIRFEPAAATTTNITVHVKEVLLKFGGERA